MPTTKKPITVPQAINSVGTELGKVGDGLDSIGKGGTSIGNGLDSIGKGADSATKNLKDILTRVVVIISIGMLGYMIPNCYNATLNYVQKKELQEQKENYQKLQSDYQHLQSENRRLRQQENYHTLERRIQDSKR